MEQASRRSNDSVTGLENGQPFRITAHNPNLKYDYCQILFCRTAKGHEMKNTEANQLITPDGKWITASDYVYKRIVPDFKDGEHPDNHTAERMQTAYLNSIIEKYKDLTFAVLDVHS